MTIRRLRTQKQALLWEPFLQAGVIAFKVHHTNSTLDSGLDLYDLNGSNLGGDIRYPKASKACLKLDLYEDRFEIPPAKWFAGLVIPYASVKDVVISDRQLGALDMLATGPMHSAFKQPNNINIRFLDELGDDGLMRFEMYSGGTIFGTANKCKELLDVGRPS